MVESKRAAVAEKFAHKETPIHIVGRHLEITDAIKSYAVNKLQRILSRFHDRVVDVTITMDVHHPWHMIDYLLNVNNVKIKVSGRTDSMYASIDQAIDHLEGKLRRYHKRLHDHHGRKPHEQLLNVDVVRRTSFEEDVNDQIEEETLRKREATIHPHAIVSKEKRILKTLTREEAVMKMELSNDPFIVYRSEDDRKLKVIYRRDDGNYGIIEAE